MEADTPKKTQRKGCRCRAMLAVFAAVFFAAAAFLISQYYLQ